MLVPRYVGPCTAAVLSALHRRGCNSYRVVIGGGVPASASVGAQAGVRCPHPKQSLLVSLLTSPPPEMLLCTVARGCSRAAAVATLKSESALARPSSVQITVPLMDYAKPCQNSVSVSEIIIDLSRTANAAPDRLSYHHRLGVQLLRFYTIIYTNPLGGVFTRF